MRRRSRTRWVCALTSALAMAACGDPASTPAATGGGTKPPAFGVAQATVVLAAFDQADAAASTAGDVEALRTQEVSPSLDVSVAAVRRAEYHQRRQPPFRHINPAFAVPPEDPSCFLVTATLQLDGHELTPTDVSQFVRAGDAWKLSHNVQVGQAAAVVARGIGSKPATDDATALDEASQTALAAEVFARTIGTSAGNRALVAASPVLDDQLAGGWEVYTQQLAGAGTTVTRKLDRAEWSACGVAVPGGTLTFVTLYATDTLAPAKGGPATVSLPAQSPDMISTGNREPVSGASVSVARVETFLLLVPAGATGAQVLGLNDAAISVTAHR
jgi:hypothetical protein